MTQVCQPQARAKTLFRQQTEVHIYTYYSVSLKLIIERPKLLRHVSYSEVRAQRIQIMILKKSKCEFYSPNCAVTSPYETKGDVNCNSASASLPFSEKRTDCAVVSYREVGAKRIKIPMDFY